MKSKTFEYPILDTWEEIPVVSSLEEGIILDGYWKRELDGFYIIIYNLQTDKLVKFLDSSVYPYVLVKNKYKGAVFSSLYYALEDKDITVSKVKTSKENMFKVHSLKYNYNTPQNSSVNPNLKYFHNRLLTPGEHIAIVKNELIQLKSKNEQNVRSKLLGESFEIIELAEDNMPILNQKIPDLRRAAFDIEVKSPKEIFPVPQKAMFPVHAVGLYDSDGYSCMYIYGFEPTAKQIVKIEKELGYIPEFKAYIDEKDMLTQLFHDLKQYPILLTYNGDNFDLPYLRHRALNLGMDVRDIPINEGFRSFHKQYHISGTIHLDLYKFFSNNSVRIYAYGAKYTRMRLDDVAEALLGYKKVEHDLWFDEMSRDQMVSYTIRDVELTLKLTTFSNNLTLALMIMVMRVGKMSITCVNRDSISQWILNWIAYEHARKGWLLPTKKDLKAVGEFESSADIDGKQYKGAIVFDQEAGVYWDVTVADYASLYPSIIKNHHLSYETIRCQHDECLESESNFVPELNHWICSKQQGILSSLVGYVRDIRVSWYKDLVKTGETKEIRSIARTVEQALKVFINATYGVFGNKKFSMFCPPVAESTTAYARHALLEAKRIAEEYGFSVIYGDTDSIFIHNIDERKFNKIKIWSIVHLGIPLGIDYKFRFLVLSGRKKNYFGVTEEGKMIVKGLQVKKANTALFIKAVFEKIKKVLEIVKTPDELDDAKKSLIITLRQSQEEIMKAKIPLEQLAKVLTLNKDFAKYQSMTPAVQIALSEMTPQNEKEYQTGTQFMGVAIKPKGIEVRTTKFPQYPPRFQIMVSYANVKSVKITEIQWSKYVNQLQQAFLPIFDAFDLDWQRDVNRKTSLDDFMKDGSLQPEDEETRKKSEKRDIEKPML